MTKTQITVRVSSDTLDAIDAAVKATGTTRNHIIDRWLAAQASSASQPIEEQVWYLAGQLAAMARDSAGAALQAHNRHDNDGAILRTLNAVNRLADAIDVLAGTAPDNSPAGGQ